MIIEITNFALRHWDKQAHEFRIIGLTPKELVQTCNKAVAAGEKFIAGYAPFCKHLFIPNISPTLCSFAPITPENRPLLRSGYSARRESELPVLERWFEGVVAPRAGWFDVILYHYEQLLKEAVEYPSDAPPRCDWGIVAIIGTLEAVEPPMPPITQMRNSLGIAQGGSGAVIDRDAYARAVDFWERHAAVR